jgi:hypothetical protein
MRMILPTLLGLVALASLAAQPTPNPNEQSWLQLGAALPFAMGADGCAYGAHRKLWRDWLGQWHWGQCVPDR